MSKTFTHSFTPERLKALDRSKLQTISENAEQKGANDLIQMCDEELALRAPKNERKGRASSVHAEGDVVTGYHFVCSKGRGVDEDNNGQFRSGSWVVAEANGGVMEPVDKEWSFNGVTVCDALDPEGNVIQFRESP